MTNDQLEQQIWQALTAYENQLRQLPFERQQRQRAQAADLFVQHVITLTREYEATGERARRRKVLTDAQARNGKVVAATA